MIEGMDMDSEAFDRLESFYGKIRKPSLPVVIAKPANPNPFNLPKLDFDQLKNQGQSRSTTNNKTSLCPDQNGLQTTIHQISHQESQQLAFKFDENCKIIEEVHDESNTKDHFGIKEEK